MPIRLRIGRGGNGRLSARILASQLAILALTGAIGFVLFAVAQRAEIDRAYEQRALDIARTTAAEPQVRQAMEYGDDGDIVQTTAERIRKASGASYVVVIDLHGIRHSHPDPALIGKPVDEPIVVLDGHPRTGSDQGATGRSANGKAPLYGPAGTLVGEVSAGIPEHDVLGELWRELPTFGLYATIAVALGSAAAFLLARRLKRSTFGLELEEIAGLLQDREAMLHGIREGVIAFDPDGRITVVNDEARDLLGLGTALGSRLEELLPDGRLRRALDGTLTGADLSVLTDNHCLVVNRMPVTLHGRELGSVVTVRDRTELIGLLRELDSVRGLTDALRAQQHEFTNRMHTVAGLLDIGDHDAAYEYAVESALRRPGADGVRTRTDRQRAARGADRRQDHGGRGTRGSDGAQRRLRPRRGPAAPAPAADHRRQPAGQRDRRGGRRTAPGRGPRGGALADRGRRPSDGAGRGQRPGDSARRRRVDLRGRLVDPARPRHRSARAGAGPRPPADTAAWRDDHGQRGAGRGLHGGNGTAGCHTGTRPRRVHDGLADKR